MLSDYLDEPIWRRWRATRAGSSCPIRRPTGSWAGTEPEKRRLTEIKDLCKPLTGWWMGSLPELTQKGATTSAGRTMMKVKTRSD